VAILPIFAVLVLGADVLGATTLQFFGWALLIGLLSGAYSSIFIASPLVALMKEREQRYRNIRERLVQRGGDRLLLSPEAVAAGVFGPDGALATTRRQRRAEAGEAAAGRGGQQGRSRSATPAGRPAGRITPGSGSRSGAPAGSGVAGGPGGATTAGAAENGTPAQAGRGPGGPGGGPGRGSARPPAASGTAGRPPGRKARKGRQR
jgi:hypothetical protein